MDGKSCDYPSQRCRVVRRYRFAERLQHDGGRRPGRERSWPAITNSAEKVKSGQ
jgi:hypothetical protein